MRSKKFAAAVLVAGAASLTLAVAVPAQADPAADQQSAQIDQQFSKAVRDKGYRISSAAAIDLAKSTCEVLKRSGSINDALYHVKNATDWSNVKDISAFASLAVQGYCPSAMPKS